MAKRLQVFSIYTISEVVFGYNISDNNEKEILVIIDKKFPKGLHVYKRKRDDKGILCKIRIQ